MIAEIRNREQLIKYFNEHGKLHVSKYGKEHTRLRALCNRLHKEGKLTKLTCANTFLFIQVKVK